MRSTAPMRIAKIGYIGISVLLTALGICLICVPNISVRAVGIVCGVTLIVFGFVKLVGYFSRDLFRLAFQYDLASGILTVLIGTALLIRPVRAMTLMCSLIGILVLADSLFKTQISIDARTFGVRQWWLILASAILAGVFGFLLILRPDESVQVMTVLYGITLLWEGLLNICTMLITVKIIRHQRPDVIEGESKEREDP